MNTSNWTGRTHRTLESAFGSGVTDLHTENELTGATVLGIVLLVVALAVIAWLCFGGEP